MSTSQVFDMYGDHAECSEAYKSRMFKSNMFMRCCNITFCWFKKNMLMQPKYVFLHHHICVPILRRWHCQENFDAQLAVKWHALGHKTNHGNNMRTTLSVPILHVHFPPSLLCLSDLDIHASFTMQSHTPSAKPINSFTKHQIQKK